MLTREQYYGPSYDHDPEMVWFYKALHRIRSSPSLYPHLVEIINHNSPTIAYYFTLIVEEEKVLLRFAQGKRVLWDKSYQFYKKYVQEHKEMEA